MTDEYVIEQGEYKNITWLLTNDGNLTVTGKGDMPDFEPDSFRRRSVTPWYRLGCDKKIKKLIIEQGITSVGAGMFNMCSSLEEVVLPESVTVIKDHAFKECISLKKINMQNILRIEDYAFVGCVNLEYIDLPDGLEFIGNGAFWGCGLKNINIPNKVTKIVNTFWACDKIEEINISKSVTEIEDAFGGCESLKSINVSPDNEHFMSVDGVLYSKNQKELIYYPENKQDKVFSIPPKVRKICFEAFLYNINLTEIYIHHDVNQIDTAFAECYALERIIVSEDNPYYSSSDGVLFNKDKTILMQYPCNKIGDYTIPDTVNKIAGGAFDGSNGLKNIFIPASVEEMKLFPRCSALESIQVSEDNEFFTSIDGVLFNKDCTELICYPNNRPDKHYDIPSSVTDMRRYAFVGSRNLESLFVSENVYSFENALFNFSECNNLSAVEVHKDNQSYCSVDGVVFSKSMEHMLIYPPAKKDETYIVTDFVRIIIFHTFFKNDYLKKVVLPPNINGMDMYAFEDCGNLEEITTSNEHFVFANGTLWDTDNHCIIWDKNGNYYQSWNVWYLQNCVSHQKEEWKSINYNISEDGTLRISGTEAVPECFVEVMRHRDNAVRDKIRKVIIDEGISKIGNWAFEGCYNLSEVQLPSGMKSIGNSAFEGCVLLSQININAELEKIGNYAFEGCERLEELPLSNSEKLIKIGKRAFEECRALRKIEIPNSMKIIDDGAFTGCKSLVEINIPKGTCSIPEWYYDCDSLESINVSDENEFYSSDNGVLYDKKKTHLLHYPAARKAESYTLPSSVSQVKAMYDNWYLKYLYIPEGVRLEGEFKPTKSLEYIDVSENNEYYASVDGVLYDKQCKRLICYPCGRKAERYDILPTVESIECEAFLNSYIKTVCIPASVKNIEYSAFAYAESLENIELDKNIKDFEIVDGKLIDCKERVELWNPNDYE